MSEVEQIEAFQERFAKAQASEVIDLPWGYALLQSEFPTSHDHNRVVVTSAAEAEEIVSTVDAVLGDAGLTHRFLSLPDDASFVGISDQLVASGYELETIATMIFKGDPVRPPENKVKSVSPATLRSALLSEWKALLPESADSVHEQLADRIRLYAQGAEVARLVVFDDLEIAAHVDLFIDRANGIAQIENLTTDANHRGHGYATSLIGEAHGRSEAAGSRLLFLAADLNDWPYSWYERLGYVDVAHTHYFTLASVP